MLSENKWTEYRREDEAVTMARIKTMTIRPGGYYDIKASVKWNGGRYAKVLRLEQSAAICEVAKVDRRKYGSSAQWLSGEYPVPYDRFLDDAF